MHLVPPCHKPWKSIVDRWLEKINLKIDPETVLVVLV